MWPLCGQQKVGVKRPAGAEGYALDFPLSLIPLITYTISKLLKSEGFKGVTGNSTTARNLKSLKTSVSSSVGDIPSFFSFSGYNSQPQFFLMGLYSDFTLPELCPSRKTSK